MGKLLPGRVSLFLDNLRPEGQDDPWPEGVVACDLDLFTDDPGDGDDGDPGFEAPLLTGSEAGRTGQRGGAPSREGIDPADDQVITTTIAEEESVLQLFPLPDRTEVVVLDREDDDRGRRGGAGKQGQRK